MSLAQHPASWKLRLFQRQEYPPPFVTHLLALLQIFACIVLTAYTYMLVAGLGVLEEQSLDESTTQSQNGYQRGLLARSAERRCPTSLLQLRLPVQPQCQYR